MVLLTVTIQAIQVRLEYPRRRILFRILSTSHHSSPSASPERGSSLILSIILVITTVLFIRFPHPVKLECGRDNNRSLA